MNDRKGDKDCSAAGKKREKPGGATETGNKRKKAEAIQSCSETRRGKKGEYSGERGITSAFGSVITGQGSSVDPITL